MIVRHNLCFLLLTTLTLSSAHFPEYCAECEQEIWEQVPCTDLPTSTTPPITTSTTTSSTPVEPPTSTTTTTTLSPPTSTTQVVYTSTIGPVPTRSPYDGITSATAYKKCYCDCKQGCKDFCRKVAVSGPKQQLTQISATGDYAPGGKVEYTHVHQRKYLPKYGGAVKSYSKPYPLAYNEVVAAQEAANSINAPNYTLEELAHLLSTSYGAKKGYPASPPPLPLPLPLPMPMPLPMPQAPIYYAPPSAPLLPLPPVYKLNNVIGSPKLNGVKAAVAVSGGGRAVAKVIRKTPYATEEKVVTAGPVYESATTPYPIESMPGPESKSYPLPAPPPPPPTATEAYPITQTEAYPMPQPETDSSALKNYPGVDGTDINPKSSSTFDMAIDNYLKDFSYGNQVIGPYSNY